LGEVYLAMTRGQDSLLVDEIVEEVREDSLDADGVRLAVRVLAPTAEEITLHAAYLTDLDKASKGNCLWQKLEVTA
jgi:DNA polymerase-3 subunit epsilon